MKTASPGSITVGKSFMKTTVCCQVTGMSLSGCMAQNRKHADVLSVCFMLQV